MSQGIEGPAAASWRRGSRKVNLGPGLGFGAELLHFARMIFRDTGCTLIRNITGKMLGFGRGALVQCAVDRTAFRDFEQA